LFREEGLYDFSTKTDSLIPKNFAGDYASSTWTRPQPAMLGGGMERCEGGREGEFRESLERERV